MVVSLKAHFDGKVIVPDEPVDLMPNERFTLHIEREGTTASRLPPGKTFAEMLEGVRQAGFSKQDVAEMKKAIEEGCERVDEDGW